MKSIDGSVDHDDARHSAFKIATRPTAPIAAAPVGGESPLRGWTRYKRQDRKGSCNIRMSRSQSSLRRAHAAENCPAENITAITIIAAKA